MNQIERLKKAAAEAPVDALLLTSEENRFYATGMHSSAGVVVVTASGGWYFTDFRYIEAARQNAQGFTVALSERGRDYFVLLAQLIGQAKIKTLGFEQNSMSVQEHTRYREKLDAELVPAQETVSALRAVKQPWEIEIMKQAQRITDLAFSEVLREIRPGVREKDIAAEIVYRLMKNGGDKVSFDPIVVSGPNSSKPHGEPGERLLREGDFVTMDFGCIYRGYCSDMTRTVALGHATDEMKKVYETVLAAQQSGIGAARAGVPGKDIDAAARQVISDAGFGDYFGHGFGHSLGVQIHESPNASPSEENPIPAGAVISAEPGIYLPGRFGVRIEDVLVIREDGCEDITGSPKQLIIL